MIEFQTIPNDALTAKDNLIYSDIIGFRAARKILLNHNELKMWFMGTEDENTKIRSELRSGECEYFYALYIGDVNPLWLMSPKEYIQTLMGKADE